MSVSVASSPALESAPAVTTAAPSLQGPGCSGTGGADLHSPGCPGRGVLAVLGPPGLRLSRRSAGSWALSPASGLPAVQPLRAAPVPPDT